MAGELTFSDFKEAAGDGFKELVAIKIVVPPELRGGFGARPESIAQVFSKACSEVSGSGLMMAKNGSMAFSNGKTLSLEGLETVMQRVTERLEEIASDEGTRPDRAALLRGALRGDCDMKVEVSITSPLL